MIKKIIFDAVSGAVVQAVKSNSDDFASRFIQSHHLAIEVPNTQPINSVVVDVGSKNLKPKEDTVTGVRTPRVVEMPTPRIDLTEIDSIINSIQTIDDAKLVLRRILEHIADRPDSGSNLKHVK